ncbi:MAG: rRNA maturation RNase YbeY [Anaerolineae bacterium]
MRRTHQIEIQVEEQVGEIDPEPLERAARLTVMLQGPDEACEVVVVLTDDAALEDLNRRFRGVPRPTDVLAFADDTRGPLSGGISGFPRYLGDVVISVDRARAQAEAVGGSLSDELQVLTVHGVLHLLGHDHARKQEKERMWAIQSEILRLLDVNIPLPE